MVWGTKSDDILIGDAGDNRLDGLDGNDRLSGLGGDDLLVGGAGADVLDGGAGNDLASYYTSTAGVTIHLRLHTASGGEAQGDTLTGIEDLEGSDRNDLISGDQGDNWLYGLDGNDTLRGGAGDDLLVGGAGADILDGGAGFNAVSYSDSARGVSIDLLTGRGAYGDAQGDWLVGITDATGSDFADTLIGNSADNNLYGGDGNDSLNGRDGDDYIEGGAGADILHGGAGWNAVSYASSEAAVAVDLATHRGSGGDAQGDWVVYFLDVVGSDFNDQLGGDGYGNGLYGGAGADTLWGNGGDDYLKGGAGADTLVGGSGRNMVSYIGSAAGIAIDLATGGASGGDAQGDKLYQISDAVGSDFNDQLGGSAGDNDLYGGAGADTLWGNGGDDYLQGGAGADTLVGSAGWNWASYAGSSSGVAVDLATGMGSGGDAEGDRLFQITDLVGSDFADQFGGDAGSNALYSEGGADTLWGNGGDDFLGGGRGADRLIGGGGRDLFVYEAANDSGTTATTRDQILDFSRGTDRIDLSDVDANTAVSGNQGFNFLGSAAFTGRAGQLHFYFEGATLVVSGDLNGDRVADFAIAVAGVTTLTATDFFL
jgi:Ca2+-binding RTX toxin-like protein